MAYRPVPTCLPIPDRTSLPLWAATTSLPGACDPLAGAPVSPGSWVPGPTWRASLPNRSRNPQPAPMFLVIGRHGRRPPGMDGRVLRNPRFRGGPGRSGHGCRTCSGIEPTSPDPTVGARPSGAHRRVLDRTRHRGRGGVGMRSPRVGRIAGRAAERAILGDRGDGSDGSVGCGWARRGRGGRRCGRPAGCDRSGGSGRTHRHARCDGCRWCHWSRRSPRRPWSRRCSGA